MTASKKRSRRTQERSNSTRHPGLKPRASTTEGYSAELFRAQKLLARARAEHIRDLRTIVDQSAIREERLAKLVQELVDAKFYRPNITPGRVAMPGSPAIPAEALQDVTAFDEQEDAARIAEEAKRGADLQREFEELIKEENEDRAERGAPPVQMA